MPYYNRVVLYFDGASRSNPHGPAGCGWVLYSMDHNGADDFKIDSGRKYLGYNVSNNQAEYEGLTEGLKYMYENDISCNGLYIRGDAEIVVLQMEGEYQVRSHNIIPYYKEAQDYLGCVDKNFWQIKHISRGNNWEADELANDAIEYGY
jgi:ribonuclease HI